MVFAFHVKSDLFISTLIPSYALSYTLIDATYYSKVKISILYNYSLLYFYQFFKIFLPFRFIWDYICIQKFATIESYGVKDKLFHVVKKKDTAKCTYVNT